MSMNAKLGLFGALAFCFLSVGVSSMAAGEDTRATLPDALSVEALGRSFLWSVNYDRVLSDDFAAGFGFGMTATKTVINGVDTDTSAKIVPLYANYYFMPTQASLFLTGGVDIVLNINEVKTYKTSVGESEFNSSAVIPTFGLGYENRADAGFLVRGAVYALVAKSVKPWFGMSFGYAW